MAYQAAAVIGTISLDEKPAVRAFDSVASKAASTKTVIVTEMGTAGKSVAALGSAVGPAAESGFTEAGSVGAKGFLKGLNSELGKKSALGQFTKLAMGGGAIAGLSMVGTELTALTKNILDMKNAWNEGKMSSGEFAEKMAASIPVLGKFWEAGRNIREMFTGEEAALARANKALSDHMDIMKSISAEVAGFKKTYDEAGKSIADLAGEWQRQAILMRAPEWSRASLQAGFSLDDDLKAIKVQQDKVEAAVKDAKGKKAELEKKYGKSDDIAAKIEMGGFHMDVYSKAVEQAQKDGTTKYPEGVFLSGKFVSTEEAQQQLDILRYHKAEIEAASKALDAEVQKQNDLTVAIKKATVAAEELAKLRLQKDTPESLLRQAVERGRSFDYIAPEMGPAYVKANAKEATPPHWAQLPNPKVQAEDVFGVRRVTAADLPQPFVKIASSTQETAKNTKMTVDVLNLLLASFKNEPAAAADNSGTWKMAGE